MEIEAERRPNPSLDKDEMHCFEALAQEWWNERGKFRALHAFNPARLTFIVEEVRRWRPAEEKSFRPFAGISMLDIGCGGGILSEPLARLGASVTGIDPVGESIEVAKSHAAHEKLGIAYRAALAEDLAREGALFNMVIASEVVEHVADLTAFLSTCRSLCEAGGLFIVSTLNRTAKSYALAIVAAEQILGLIPRGTHHWRKFIKPQELTHALAKAGFRTIRQSGIVLNPISGTWELQAGDVSINYILSAEAV
jgi:2-polyprenyl-6-hydroxyphenyl methylase/3-demethylubiquinone-9 3-methyltransferase